MAWSSRSSASDVIFVAITSLARQLSRPIPGSGHGKHTYDASQFGITDQSLAQHFGVHRDRFGPLSAKEHPWTGVTVSQFPSQQL